FNFVFYLAIMLALSMNIEHESDRYLSPVMPLIMIIFWKRLSVMDKEKEKVRSRFRYVLLFFIIAYNLLRTYFYISQWYNFPPLEMH
ncbi:MAG: hypothetical protein NZ516_12355, partial [Raineya sp.]|nr:hypothetical protein [Raineya sp.]